MKNKGFTIPELLVAVAVFSIVVGIVANLFISGLGAQRSFLQSQMVIDQSSSLGEYMSRALRQAQKYVGTPEGCLSTIGLNYEVTHAGQGVKFVNTQGQCQGFYLDGAVIKEVTAMENVITSNNLAVNDFRVAVAGESQNDDVQPRVTFFVELQAIGGGPRSKIQTTVSQRKADILE